MSLLGLAVEGGLIIAGGFAGHLEGYLMGSKVRNVTQLFLQPGQTPDSVWCLCGHAMSFHRKREGACSAYMVNVKGQVMRAANGWDMHCPCTNFVADPDQAPARPKGELEL